LAAAVVAALVLAGGGVALALKIQADQAEETRLIAEKAEAEAKAEEEAQAAAAQRRQEAADQQERDERELAVSGIETSIKTMAEEHVKEDIIEGPVLQVTCDPVNGGSTDDLTQKTTVFQCFVANEDNGDGTMSGYYYNATMNWDSGQYTYGFGEP